MTQRIVINGTVAEWRDLSFYADMKGQTRLADTVWESVAGMSKYELKNLCFTPNWGKWVLDFAKTMGVPVFRMYE